MMMKEGTGMEKEERGGREERREEHRERAERERGTGQKERDGLMDIHVHVHIQYIQLGAHSRREGVGGKGREGRKEGWKEYGRVCYNIHAHERGEEEKH